MAKGNADPTTVETWIVVVLIVFVLLRNIEKVAIVGDWLRRATGKLFGWGGDVRAARRAVHAITRGTAKYMKDTPELIPPPPKVVWVGRHEAGSELRDGNVIVFTHRRGRHGSDTANLTLEYVYRGLLGRTRGSVDETTMLAADFNVACGILRAADDDAALDALDEIHHPRFGADDPELARRILELDRIDMRGFLLRVLLAEYARIGGGLHGTEPTDAYRRDTAEFATWLYGVATTTLDTAAGMIFEGKFIRVALLFVGPKPCPPEYEPQYFNTITAYRDHDIDVVYVAAVRAADRRAARTVYGAYNDPRLVLSGRRYEYEFRADYPERVHRAGRGTFLGRLHLRRRPERDLLDQHFPYYDHRRRFAIRRR